MSIDGNNQCIFKCIVKDEKNFSFIYHGIFGHCGDFDMYFLFNYKNGEKNKTLTIQHLKMMNMHIL